MLRIHVLAAAAGVLALVAAASSVQAKAGGKKHHGLHGVVVKVEKDADKESGKITVKTGGKNKKTGVETPEVERPIQVTSATTFVKVSHKKGEKGSPETTPATFGQLEDGDHVSIEVKNDKAVEVKFHGNHKKAA
jgi:ribosomal protein L21E